MSRFYEYLLNFSQCISKQSAFSFYFWPHISMSLRIILHHTLDFFFKQNNAVCAQNHSFVYTIKMKKDLFYCKLICVWRDEKHFHSHLFLSIEVFYQTVRSNRVLIERVFFLSLHIFLENILQKFSLHLYHWRYSSEIKTNVSNEMVPSSSRVWSRDILWGITLTLCG